MVELQRKCVFGCSEHSSTDRQIINGMKSRLDNTCPHHYVKMCLGRVDHRACMVFSFPKIKKGAGLQISCNFCFLKTAGPQEVFCPGNQRERAALATLID